MVPHRSGMYEAVAKRKFADPLFLPSASMKLPWNIILKCEKHSIDKYRVMYYNLCKAQEKYRIMYFGIILLQNSVFVKCFFVKIYGCEKIRVR